MKDLKTNFSLITPNLIGDDEKVRAWFTLKNKQFKPSRREIAGLNLGFNTPEGKDIVAQNRLALLDNLDLDADWVAYADQVHSNRIQIVTQGGTYPSTDGLITQIPGLTLAIQVADCAAVLVWDTESQIIGAFHAGWRGAVGDIVPIGIEMMIEQGANSHQMKAFVSPCLSLKNFEVGNKVADQFPDQFVDYTSYEKPHVDLKSFLKNQIKESGIHESNIEIRDECTIDQAESFYSYRREGKQTGRMMGLIQITE